MFACPENKMDHNDRQLPDLHPYKQNVFPRKYHSANRQCVPDPKTQTNNNKAT